ncbi:sulfur carrier protein ThiS [Maribacter vaceletii]|uniref:Sulfur carrier protein ThiS n=1 Tax=Maribacter vaceletii TaxID=1206816 RepID=A0A495E8P4_9FLAO|nr:sulfur carrier protein ThiS [Maribacter vaceletii]RKR13300.1 sulfur carrier protein ThiS [Maribacter vaceletii]
MITIYVNDSPLEIRKNTNVLELLKELKFPIQGVAVAIDNTVIPTATWETHLLDTNNKVLIIQAAQGG